MSDEEHGLGWNVVNHDNPNPTGAKQQESEQPKDEHGETIIKRITIDRKNRTVTTTYPPFTPSADEEIERQPLVEIGSTTISYGTDLEQRFLRLQELYHELLKSHDAQVANLRDQRAILRHQLEERCGECGTMLVHCGAQGFDGEPALSCPACTVRQLRDQTSALQSSHANEREERRTEQCCECNVYVSEWVEAEHRNGRICRPCEELVSLRATLAAREGELARAQAARNSNADDRDAALNERDQLKAELATAQSRVKELEEICFSGNEKFVEKLNVISALRSQLTEAQKLISDNHLVIEGLGDDLKEANTKLAEAFQRGYFCACAVYVKEEGQIDTMASSLINQGGDWTKADPEDVETFKAHGLGGSK